MIPVDRRSPPLVIPIEEFADDRGQAMSLWQILDLPIEDIALLSEEQFRGAAEDVREKYPVFCTMIRQHPEMIKERWSRGMLALAVRPYVQKDINLQQRFDMLSQILSRAFIQHSQETTISTYQDISAGYQDISARYDRMEREAKEHMEQNKAIWAEEHRQWEEEHRQWEEEFKKAEEDQRIAQERIQKAIAMLNGGPQQEHPVHAPQDAFDLNDNEPPNGGWGSCWMVALIVGCLAVAYGIFRGRNAPNGE